jgi:hypothetical protein
VNKEKLHAPMLRALGHVSGLGVPRAFAGAINARASDLAAMANLSLHKTPQEAAVSLWGRAHAEDARKSRFYDARTLSLAIEDQIPVVVGERIRATVLGVSTHSSSVPGTFWETLQQRERTCLATRECERAEARQATASRIAAISSAYTLEMTRDANRAAAKGEDAAATELFRIRSDVRSGARVLAAISDRHSQHVSRQAAAAAYMKQHELPAPQPVTLTLGDYGPAYDTVVPVVLTGMVRERDGDGLVVAGDLRERETPLELSMDERVYMEAMLALTGTKRAVHVQNVRGDYVRAPYEHDPKVCERVLHGFEYFLRRYADFLADDNRHKLAAFVLLRKYGG